METASHFSVSYDMGENKEPLTQKDWAIYYYGLGFNPFPISNPYHPPKKSDYPLCKTPLFKWGAFQKKKVKIDQINSWWDNRFPKANIGLICGSISNLMVLDVDIDEERNIDGFEELETITPEGFDLEKDLRTPTVRTGRGGRHFYFKSHQRTPRKRTNIKKGIDFQGEGSLVIAPPSVHINGNRYEWVNPLSTGMMDVPDWLLKVIWEMDNQKKGFTTKNKKKAKKGQDRYLYKGQRNNGLVKLMGRWFNEVGNDEEELVRRLKDYNKKYCVPPLPEAELLVLSREFRERTPFFKKNGEFGITENFNLTDKGNALRLQIQYGKDLKFCKRIGRWFIFDGKKWTEDEVDKIKEYAMEIGKLVEAEGIHYKEGRTKEDIDAYDNYIRWARNSENAARINAIVDLAGVLLPSTVEDYDKNDWFFNVQNGTLDLKLENNPDGIWKLRDHSRGDMVTKISNAVFDPDARCPKWEAFLEKVFMNDRDMIDYVQKIIGYSLTGDIREDCFFIIDGLGFNGKSTFVRVLTELTGDYCQTTTVDTFIQSTGPRVRNDLAKLRGARIVFGPEVGEGKKLDEQILKMLSGRDKVVCRYLWKEEFSYDAKCKLFFYGNYKPEISGTDYGIWRRPRIIEFPYTFNQEEKIDKYEDILVQEELSGILNWALEGCKKWQLEGLNTPKCLEDKIEDYKAESNELTDFLAKSDYVIDLENTQTKIYKSDLYKEYADYCEENKYLPISQKMFGNKIHGLKVKSSRDSKGRYWIGIRLKTQDEIKEEFEERKEEAERIVKENRHREELKKTKEMLELHKDVEDLGVCSDV